jgi:hypothetical protein
MSEINVENPRIIPLSRYLLEELAKAMDDSRSKDSIFQLSPETEAQTQQQLQTHETTPHQLERRPRYKLRDGITFHMYISQTPCTCSD